MTTRIIEKDVNLTEEVEVYSNEFDQYLDFVLEVTDYDVQFENTEYGIVEKVNNVEWKLRTPNGKIINRFTFAGQYDMLKLKAEYIAVNDASVAYGYMQEIPDYEPYEID